MAKCPKCGSNRARFRREEAGSSYRSTYKRTGVKRSWILPSGVRKGKRKVSYQTRGFCPDCGYSWEVVSKTKSFFQSLLGLFFLLIIISTIVAAVNDGKNKNQTENQSTANTSVTEEASLIWAKTPTALNDFQYVMENDEIHLMGYRGRNKKVYVAASYEYEDANLSVVELDGTFTFKSVDSVIIGDGVTTLSHHLFNGSGIKYLYLPASVSAFTGWSYLHDAEAIYYGGTEEQWEEVCQTERSNIDVKQIICNASINDLP